MQTENTLNIMIHSQSQTEKISSLGNFDKLTQTQQQQRDENQKKVLDVESIKEQLEKQLTMNKIKSTGVEKVKFGSAKLIENEAVVLDFSDNIRKIERLQKKIEEKKNSNLEYTSPLQVVRSEPDQDEADGVLFYVAIQFKKALDYGEDTSETDSGMGESGHSRSGESTEPEEDEIDRASAAQMSTSQTSNYSNITKSSVPLFVRKKGSKRFVEPKMIKTLASDEKVDKLLQREEIKKRYTILRRKTQRLNLKASRNVKGEDGLQKVTKPMWFIPGQNSFHVNINPSFSSQQTKCYSFQCKPRVRTQK